MATIRNARGETYPDPASAAEIAMQAGADGITAHLREDRRHISDADIDALATLTRQRGRPLNLEMAVTAEMEAIALAHHPYAACLVPERREEVTTEGGLDVERQHNRITPVVADAEARPEFGSRCSSSRAPARSPPPRPLALRWWNSTPAPIAWRCASGAARRPRVSPSWPHAARQASGLGLEVHAGHGIDFETVGAIAAIPEIVELNIGHFLIGEAIFTGLERRDQPDSGADGRGAGRFGPKGRGGGLIIGIGSDLTDIRRIEKTLARFGERFAAAHLHRRRARPIRAPGRRRRQLRQALRRQGGLRQGAGHRHAAWSLLEDMGVVNARSGQPTLALTGGAAERLAALTPAGCASPLHLSLTDDHPYAQAFVVIEALPAVDAGAGPALAPTAASG